ncbi:MAG: HEAT repeat domain-containing protein [Nostoc sp. DedSLP03]|uniref:HEAT repeat domain-containing protein n=1 Tax=Nostoc sp. DedSLP03 TaxID=3075400 RepID=UPI002AD58C63|nr:HEAT repeat domain-containing protein [Nostoc sp. DedSLP03]MDZ7969725.1 HEAT repeat domain-containing protein [Nostoc sp. DedSLP03]
MTFITHIKSAFSEPQKLTLKMALTLLSVSSPLLLNNTSWAQIPGRTKVFNQSQQLQKKSVQSNLDNINAALTQYTSKNTTLDEKRKVIDVFKQNLKNPDKQVRIAATNALSAIGTGADDALEDLKNLLKTEQNRDVLISVILAIQSIDAKPAILELTNIFKDENQDLQVRSMAAGALEKTTLDTKQAKELIPLLLKSLKNQSVDRTNLRISAASALSKMYDHLDIAPDAVQILTESLKDPAWRVRRYAADALGNIGVNAKSAIDPIIAAYKEDKNYTMRQSAVVALGLIGSVSDAKDGLKILPVLNQALNDQSDIVRSSAAEAMRFITTKFAEDAKSNKLKTKELKNAIPEFEEALKSLEKLDPEEKNSLKVTIENIQSSLKELKHRQFINQILEQPSVWGIGAYLVLLFGIFWLRPLWLLKIDQALKSVGSFKLPVIDKEISLSWLLLILKYHPRVLDAWVEAHLKSAQEAFQQKDTVRNRNVYIPIPVVNNGQTFAQLRGKDLRSTFKKQRACLLIQGDGGVGKTSLSCQIANWAMSDDETERLCKHRMLPVLIEEELEIPNEIENQSVQGKKSPSTRTLIAAIQGQLQNLTDETEDISEQLLERLLRERRILVIVDHLSEMNEATRKAIRPDFPDFYVNALVVTSRSEEKLGGVTKTTLKPLLIEGNRLSSFMEAYLTQANRRDLFTDPEFFQACSHLSQMVGGRKVTALLAKLYADQLIAVKVEGIQQSPLIRSGNIPELMLWYLNELNRSVTAEGNKLSDRIVRQDAKIIAWECVKQTFQPTTAKRDTIVAVLSGNDPENRLKYLEERLHLIQTIGAAQDKIRFALDPLAEYLAAMQMLELCQNNQDFWNEFWHQITTASVGIDPITGFLLALQDCIQILGKEANVPQTITVGLSQLLDATELVEVQQDFLTKEKGVEIAKLEAETQMEKAKAVDNSGGNGSGLLDGLIATTLRNQAIQQHLVKSSMKLESSAPSAAFPQGQIICTHCGTKNPSSHKFCSKCGVALTIECDVEKN